MQTSGNSQMHDATNRDVDREIAQTDRVDRGVRNVDEDENSEVSNGDGENQVVGIILE